MPNGVTMTIVAYKENHAFTQLWEQQECPDGGTRDLGKYLLIWKKEYPSARQYDFKVLWPTLQEIANFIEDQGHDIPYCEHVFVYDRDLMLLSFQDLFWGGEIHLSRTLAKPLVVAFAKGIGGTYNLIANPWKTGGRNGVR